MDLKNLFKDFKKYYKMLMIGFIGGVIAFIFSFTFEDLLPQINNFWIVFFCSLFLAVVWSFLLGIISFLLLKLMGCVFE